MTKLVLAALCTLYSASPYEIGHEMTVVVDRRVVLTTSKDFHNRGEVPEFDCKAKVKVKGGRATVKSEEGILVVYGK